MLLSKTVSYVKTYGDSSRCGPVVIRQWEYNPFCLTQSYKDNLGHRGTPWFLTGIQRKRVMIDDLG
jgi:hypothetical protein